MYSFKSNELWKITSSKTKKKKKYSHQITAVVGRQTQKILQYKIITTIFSNFRYPCPETMELSPGPDKGTPECNCPPGTAQHYVDSLCYPIFQQGPCESNQYFTPEPDRWILNFFKSRNVSSCRLSRDFFGTTSDWYVSNSTKRKNRAKNW